VGNDHGGAALDVDELSRGAAALDKYRRPHFSGPVALIQIRIICEIEGKIF
jgi:hypothetical protein